ncbi:MAG: RhuM family protein [Pseudomonas sp.]
MREATVRKFRIVQQEGSRSVSRTIEHYSLDAIISVGYQVNSLRAIQFRQWATGVLRELAIKGYGHSQPTVADQASHSIFTGTDASNQA